MIFWRLPAALFLLTTSATFARQFDEPRAGGSGSDSRELGDDPDFSEPHGLVRVRTWFDQGGTELLGVFADVPEMEFHQQSELIGNCRLMTYSPTTCAPPCGSASACVAGECAPWPVPEDKGELLWTWPDGEEVVSPDRTLGYFATGTATAAGEVSIEVEDFALTSSTIGSPEERGSWLDAIISRGSGDAVLRWKEPILHARIRLHMTDCIVSHGGFAAAEIECEGPDTGELIVPGSFLDEVEAGDWNHTQCGDHSFDRYHASSPDDDTLTRLETVGPGTLFYHP